MLFQRDDAIGAVHISDRSPAEFTWSSATLAQRRVDKPECRRRLRQDGFRLGLGSARDPADPPAASPGSQTPACRAACSESRIFEAVPAPPRHDAAYCRTSLSPPRGEMLVDLQRSERRQL